MTDNSWQKITSAFLIGLGVGAGLGFLFAPKSGKETRKEIADVVKGSLDEVLAQGSNLGHHVQTSFENATEHLKKAAEAAEGVYREVKAVSS